MRTFNWPGLISSTLPMLFLCLTASPVLAQNDSGIHVSEPKVYDARALELMMEDLARNLRGTDFINQTALANALGNMQGFNSTDFSQSLSASGATGPQAAATFANAAGITSPAAAAAPATSTPATAPTVSINVAPTASAGMPAASTPSGGGASFGPAGPALPVLQTAPTFNPGFGENQADLLNDEANLTYQLFNLRMMLERALSDRLYLGQARLQAVLGFDIDIEPDSRARDAAAVVEVTINLNCADFSLCESLQPPSIVAMMPEEGSHNSATLSQKAHAFSGALVANVFSVGYSAQKRSQVFYLYSDMDTLSFQKPAAAGQIRFGWQFRPVLGRRTVQPGKRHLIVILALPAVDNSHDPTHQPYLVAHVHTSWTHYDKGLQTTTTGNFFSHSLPPASGIDYQFAIPDTAKSQHDLEPHIENVYWSPSDATNGVAIVTGQNFFRGTTVRFGSKTYSGNGDGLVIKSDQQLEIALPDALANFGGVLSGRYGAAKPLKADTSHLPNFYIPGIEVDPAGDSLDWVDVTLSTPDRHSHFQPNVDQLGLPFLSVNGVQITTATFSIDDHPWQAHLQFTAPASIFAAGASVAVSFPFAGPEWSHNIPYFNPTINVVRIGGKTASRLIIVVNNAGFSCDGWSLVLDPAHGFNAATGLQCDGHAHVLTADIPTKLLDNYKQFVLTNAGFTPIAVEIPKPKTPTPKPSLSAGQNVMEMQGDLAVITFKGANLDSVTKVLLDKTELQVVKKDAKTLAVSIPKTVTDKPRNKVQLQFISDGNDPLLATFSVAPQLATKPK